jgi:thiol-disulfide isomerase/thioredoxin
MVKFSIKISIIIVLTLIISVLSGCIDVSSENKSIDNPDYDTDFEFTLLNGEKKMMSDYQGKYVLIDFFGVRCPPCQQQMLVLTQIYEEYKQKNLEIVSINVWIVSGETSELVEQFIAEAKGQGVYLNWTFGVDDSMGTLFYKFIPADAGVPMVYILDKNGNIYYSNVGYTDYSELTGIIDELINSGGNKI